MDLLYWKIWVATLYYILTLRAQLPDFSLKAEEVPKAAVVKYHTLDLRPLARDAREWWPEAGDLGAARFGDFTADRGLKRAGGPGEKVCLMWYGFSMENVRKITFLHQNLRSSKWKRNNKKNWDNSFVPIASPAMCSCCSLNQSIYLKGKCGSLLSFLHSKP